MSAFVGAIQMVEERIRDLQSRKVQTEKMIETHRRAHEQACQSLVTLDAEITDLQAVVARLSAEA